MSYGHCRTCTCYKHLVDPPPDLRRCYQRVDEFLNDCERPSGHEGSCWSSTGGWEEYSDEAEACQDPPSDVNMNHHDLSCNQRRYGF